MRCKKARELIVLDEGGDATERQRRRLQSHIAGCDECRRFAAAEPLPFAALRTPMPLGDADFAAIRARVLSQRPRTSLLMPFRFAAAAIVVVLALVALLFVDRPEAPRVIAPVAVTPPAVPQPIRTASLPPPSHPLPAGDDRAPARRRREAAGTAAGQPQPEMRIVITTADPEVRIIWIVNPTQPKEES